MLNVIKKSVVEFCDIWPTIEVTSYEVICYKVTSYKVEYESVPPTFILISITTFQQVG